MSKLLRWIGLCLLAAAAWAATGAEVGWIADDRADAWFASLLKAGLAVLGGGLLLGLTGRAGRGIGGSRCQRCGARTERGQAYCGDHLRDTVHRVREQARADGMY